MEQLRTQGTRAILEDLTGRVAPMLNDPTAVATVNMIQYVLAHLQAR